jgi:hypothetical protein
MRRPAGRPARACARQGAPRADRTRRDRAGRTRSRAAGRPARREIGVEQPEIRDAARIREDGFAIQDQVVCRKSRERVGDRLKAPPPVVPRPRMDGRLSLLQVRLGAIAVVEPRAACELPPPRSMADSRVVHRRCEDRPRTAGHAVPFYCAHRAPPGVHPSSGGRFGHPARAALPAQRHRPRVEWQAGGSAQA